MIQSPRPAGPVGRIEPLEHDTLKAHLARVLEHGRDSFALPSRRQPWSFVEGRDARRHLLDLSFPVRFHLEMTIFLRRQRAHDIIEGRSPMAWKDDDYAVVDGVLIGRIFKERLPEGEKWRWFLNSFVASIRPGVEAGGNCDTLDEAKAALAVQYRKVRGDA